MGVWMFFKKDNNSNEDFINDIEKLSEEINSCKRQIKELKEKQQSYEEILDSHYNLFNTLFIDYDLKAKGIMKNLQELCQEVLDFAANICNKHDLSWFIMDGTLLGAKRHSTYIPWDDDVDMGMLRGDFDKFNQIADDEIKNNGIEDYLTLNVYPLTRENFIMPFTKLDCMLDDDHVLGGIDVFPFDFAKDNRIDHDEFMDMRNELFVGLVTCEDKKSLISDFHKKFNLDYDKGKYIIKDPTAVRYKYRSREIAFWDVDKFLPLGQIKFNGRHYSCPRDVDHYLKLEYGDYMKIPKVLKDQHHNIDTLRDIENIDEKYETFIAKLQEANANFK